MGSRRESVVREGKGEARVGGWMIDTCWHGNKWDLLGRILAH